MVNGQKHTIRKFFGRENNEEFGFWAIEFCDIMEAYDINGYTFYTKSKDMKSVAHNSGVRIGVVLHQMETCLCGLSHAG